jgi:sporulation protein YlmC with PRC-barrel domain
MQGVVGLGMLKLAGGVNRMFGVLAVGMLTGAVTAIAQTNAAPAPLRARQLIGMKVEDSDGQKAGTIRNLVLNMNTGTLRYVVIGTGGFFGVNATLKLAPGQVMSAATTKRQTLAIRATTTQWRDAAVFEYSNLAQIAEPGQAAEIARYFHVSVKKTSREKKSLLSKTGREVKANAQPTELKFSSDLMGKKIINTKQEKIGEVVDLLVGFGESHPVFVILSSGRLFQDNSQYAIPLSAFQRSNNKLILAADAAKLQQAQPFDQVAWEARGTNHSHSIYRYLTPGE